MLLLNCNHAIENSSRLMSIQKSFCAVCESRASQPKKKIRLTDYQIQKKTQYFVNFGHSHEFFHISFSQTVLDFFSKILAKKNKFFRSKNSFSYDRQRVNVMKETEKL